MWSITINHIIKFNHLDTDDPDDIFFFLEISLSYMYVT